MSWQCTLLIALGTFVGLPLLCYLCFKMGALGYFRGKQKFDHDNGTDRKENPTTRKDRQNGKQA